MRKSTTNFVNFRNWRLVAIELALMIAGVAPFQLGWQPSLIFLGGLLTIVAAVQAVFELRGITADVKAIHLPGRLPGPWPLSNLRRARVEIALIQTMKVKRRWLGQERVEISDFFNRNELIFQTAEQRPAFIGHVVEIAPNIEVLRREA
jgi:hypothetical protein